MTAGTTTPVQRSQSGLLLPAALLVGLLALLGWQAGALRLPAADGMAPVPQTVRIAPRPYAYRAVGSFLSDGAVVDGPLIEVATPAPLELMTYQVSVGEYARCVAAAACRPAQPRRGADRPDLPVTGVSHDDAMRYADWLGAATGVAWRLPTVAEWVFAAGSRAGDDALGLVANTANPAERWLAAYAQETAAATGAAAQPLPRGTGGLNEHGVADLAGPVWEWTATCDGRTTLAPDGSVLRRLEACGAHYLEGRHRAVMTNFVRDAASGGCSTGLPPDNLGFRLVREPGWVGTVAGWWAGLFGGR